MPRFYEPTEEDYKEYQKTLYERYGKHYSLKQIKSGKLAPDIHIEWGSDYTSW